MANKCLTDDEVEQEIARLQESPYVALARMEQRIRYQRRQQLYNLRFLDKKGRELEKSGITMDVLRGLADDNYFDDFGGCP